MNVVVYVSDALRTDHLGCYGARYVNTRTIDELAAGGVRYSHAISAAPWTAPSTTSIVTGMYAHHHGYLHWDAPLDPSIETAFRAFAAHGYEVASFVFDTNYLFKDLAEANVARHLRDARRRVRVAAREADTPFFLYVHNWATHMPYDIVHADRKNWLAAKQEVIEGIQSDSAVGARGDARGLPHGGRAPVRGARRLVPRGAGDAGAAREHGLRVPLDHGESWGERFGAKDDVKGVYHMHGAALFDEIVEVPLILSAPGRLEPAVVESQVRTVDLMPTLLELAGLPARETDGESLLHVDGDREAIVAGTDMGALTKLAVRKPPWKLILHVESGEEEAYRLDEDPRELHPRADAPQELRDIVFRELESAETHELTEEEEATVAKRLSDLGYL